MSAIMITGYTGERHITPAMDASVYRSAFGDDSFITSEGNKMAGSMPSVTEFTVMDGVTSMQGHMIQVTQETLPVDICANGHKRIDLVCMRFTHDNNTQIDDAELVIIKGVEVADPNQPVTPEYNEGIIDAGATIVDFPLYKITLAGSATTVTQLAEVVDALDEVTKVGVATTKLYPRVSDGLSAVDFGGTGNQTTIYFGNSPADDRPIPTSYSFGNANAQAAVNVSGVNLRMRDAGKTLQTVVGRAADEARVIFGNTAIPLSIRGTEVDVYSNAAITLQPYTGSHGSLLVGSTDASNVNFRPHADNRHYLGASNYRFKNVYSVNGVTTSSDRRKKKNISEDFAKLKTFFKKLRPVSYEYNDVETDRERIGFIAQDVEDALTESELNADKFAALNIDEEGFYSLNYAEFIALNTKMIQELQTEVENLKNEIERMKK